MDYISTKQEFAVIKYAEPVIIELQSGSHMATSQEYTIYDILEEAIDAAKELFPDFQYLPDNFDIDEEI
jgi:hypothetical protein